MKKLIALLIFFVLTEYSFAQFQKVWTSAPIDYNTLSGWTNFEKDGSGWSMRRYSLDSIKFQIMAQGFSDNPEYTYNFTDAEKLAGYQIYALNIDLTNDGKTEFYVLAYSGASSSYRQSFKIIDLVNDQIVFSKDDANFYYSYPELADINNDGNLECLVTKLDYPSYQNYYFEIYSTGVTGNTDETPHPVNFKLEQNFPNPFNPSTNIIFNLDRKETVALKIYDIKGELVKNLLNSEFDAGVHKINWDGTNNNGLRQASGIYFYRLQSGNKSAVKKMILLK